MPPCAPKPVTAPGGLGHRSDDAIEQIVRLPRLIGFFLRILNIFPNLERGTVGKLVIAGFWIAT
jgi:hypothetical protein